MNHDGAYGSGRFCSTKCARGFATKAKRKEINEKVSKKLRGVLQERSCPTCERVFAVISSKKKRYCSRSCAARGGWQHVSRDDIFLVRSVAQRKSYESGRNTVGGGTTQWFDYNGLKVQGAYELRTCKILDAWKHGGLIHRWKYTNDRIPYTWEDGTEHTYLLDFKVYANDGSTWYIETKGFVREHDERKWQAARELGLDLRVWFKEDIEREEAIHGLMV